MFAVQFGVQFERYGGGPSQRKPSKHGPLPLRYTASCRLGAGRSQVQILSPRYNKTPGKQHFWPLAGSSKKPHGEQTGNQIFWNSRLGKPAQPVRTDPIGSGAAEVEGSLGDEALATK